MENVRSFETDVIGASRQTPIVVDFWAEWCGPCRVLGPVLEKLESEADGKWRLAKVDVEEHQEAAAHWRIQGIPAVKLFVDGGVVSEFTGALPEAQVKKWLESSIPTAQKQAAQEAEVAIQEGDRRRALSLLEAVGDDLLEPNGRTLLALLVFGDDPDRSVALVEDVDATHQRWDQAAAIKLLHGLLETPEDGAGDDENEVLYRKGIQSLREGDYEAALDCWIRLIGMPDGRKVDDDGARRACIALFHILGEAHPATETYRRTFSSALY